MRTNKSVLFISVRWCQEVMKRIVSLDKQGRPPTLLVVTLEHRQCPLATFEHHPIGYCSQCQYSGRFSGLGQFPGMLTARSNNGCGEGTGKSGSRQKSWIKLPVIELKTIPPWTYLPREHDPKRHGRRPRTQHLREMEKTTKMRLVPRSKSPRPFDW